MSATAGTRPVPALGSVLSAAPRRSGTIAKRWPAPIWTLLAGTLLTRCVGFAYPFLSYRLHSLGYAAAGIGNTLALVGLGWLLGQLVFGRLADRAGKRRVLIGVLLAAAAELPLLGLVTATTAVTMAALTAGSSSTPPGP